MTDQRLVALDFGAESGRTIVGRFDGDRLSIESVHRYANTPVRLNGTLYWDFPRQFGDILAGLAKAARDGPVASVAVDTWGVDYGFIDARGRLLANPVHYRDTRHEAMPEAAFAVVPRDEVYCRHRHPDHVHQHDLPAAQRGAGGGPHPRAGADRLLMMPDLFSHFLCGSTVAEYTEASTSRRLDPWTRDWARPLFDVSASRPTSCPRSCRPGRCSGELLPEVAEETGLAGTKVVATAAHDTASAVAATPLAGPSTAYISSGTWSLVGLEVAEPLVNERTQAANITNEGGYGGTITLLKNVMGLWLVQQCRSALWRPDERPTYEELSRLARRRRPPPPSWTRPTSASCGQATCLRGCASSAPRPGSPSRRTRPRCCGSSSRASRTATRSSWTSWPTITGRPVEQIHIVAVAANNELLCQLTADISGRQVVAGPVEATAIGNIAIQAIAAGELADIGEARELDRALLPDGPTSRATTGPRPAAGMPRSWRRRAP